MKLILDGRNRLRVCQEAGIEPKFETYTGDDPIGYVVRANLTRRHLTISQRAVLALRIEPIFAEKARTRVGGRPKKGEKPVAIVPPVSPEKRKSRTLAANAVGVSARLVSDTKVVQRDAPDLLPQVLSGAITIPEAKKNIRQRAKAVKVAEMANREPAPITSMGPFSVILADPPWPFDDAEPTRAVENHYPTPTLDEIKSLPVPAATDSVLVLWSPAPIVPDALEVMRAWGFRYKTSAVWIKDKFGMGYYFRLRHELLLIGIKGNFSTPDPEDRPDSVVSAPRTKHSAKPEEVYDLIERMYPLATNRVELLRSPPVPRGLGRVGK